MRALTTSLVLVAVIGIGGRALAVERFALVIGNRDYGPEVGLLANPHKDAALIGAALEGLDFEVETVLDASRGQILAAVDAHARRLGQAGERAVGFLYYSGHGAAKPGTDRNYIIPVGVDDARTTAVWFDSVPLDELRRLLAEHAPKAANIVVFDACRNELQLPVKALGEKGFAAVEAWGGMLIAYATAPGKTASDGEPNAPAGPYAQALAEELSAARGLTASALFGRVRFNVRRRQPEQSPWFLYGLDREVAFGKLAVEPEPEPAPPTPTVDREAQAKTAYEAASATSDPRRLDLAAAQFPDTYWGQLAALDAADLREAETKREAEQTPPRPPPIGVADWRAAQAELARLGRYRGALDGEWGGGSQAAMRAFQLATGITPVDGALTREGLAALKRAPTPEVDPAEAAREAWRGLEGSRDTRALRGFLDEHRDSAEAAEARRRLSALATEHRNAQEKLRALGHYDGPIDGEWGPGSTRAMQQFQKDLGVSPADGALTRASLTALLEAPTPRAKPPSESGESTPQSGRREASEAPDKEPSSNAGSPLVAVQGDWRGQCSELGIGQVRANIRSDKVDIKFRMRVGENIQRPRTTITIHDDLSVSGSWSCKGFYCYCATCSISGVFPQLNFESFSCTFSR